MHMLDLILVLSSVSAWAASGLLSLGGGWKLRLGTVLGVAGAVGAGGAAIHALAGAAPAVWETHLWRLPLRLELDALSAAFLLPLQLIGGLGLLYGREYWPQDLPKGTGRSLRLFYGFLVAAMSLLLVARQGILFLVAWELMATSAFFLVGTEHERPEVHQSAWVYLVCTHTGTLLLTAMVILLGQRLGGFLWLPLPGALPASSDLWILLLAFLGFGFKAGLVPLHFWLPAAHASAPSHVSAILSGVMLKMGIYGLLRVSSLLPGIPRGAGSTLLALGAVSAVYGVGHALAQGDYKRLLAYSSIENLGIIAMGVGLGWTGRATHDPWLTALGFGGALFHVWNHSVFKGLLFYGAGAVLHATGTRDLESLGGLAARMPRTARWLLPGVLAVSALPPFNAFLSEWLLYRGLFSALQRGYPWSATVALIALAFAGGLAAVAFAKFYGVLFLGTPRSRLGAQAHDPSLVMLGPMVALAILCLVLGLGSLLLLPSLDRVVAVLAPGSQPLLGVGLRADLAWLTGLGALLLGVGSLTAAWLRRGPRPAPALAPPSWDCGYAASTARMQYTGSSFADGWAALLPGVRQHARRIRSLFPKPHAFRSVVQDEVGDQLVAPRMAALAERLLRYRWLQPGILSVYILYVLLTLVAVFLWTLFRAGGLG
jgi:hydrogenase-4 component B